MAYYSVLAVSRQHSILVVLKDGKFFLKKSLYLFTNILKERKDSVRASKEDSGECART